MKSNNKILLFLLVLLVIGGVLYFFFRTKPQNLSNEQDNQAGRFSKLIGTEDFLNLPGFYFTISPDNKYLLYFSKGGKIHPYGYNEDDYNLNAINLNSNQKFIIDKQDIFGSQLTVNLSHGCWSTDSKFCVLPDINIVIDFTGQKPNLIKQYMSATRKTSDSLTSGTFTCSDCGTNIILGKTFDSNHHGDEYYSPNNLYIASLVKKEIFGRGGFVSPPEFYIERLSDHKKILIGENVYKLAWTSDSSSIYVYKCESGGGCGSSSDALYKVDVSTLF